MRLRTNLALKARRGFFVYYADPLMVKYCMGVQVQGSI